MKSVVSAARSQMERRRFYFREEREEIARSNIATLRYAALLTAFLLVALLICARFIIVGWQPSVFHYAFLPVSLIMCVVA